ncbi:MAG: carboxymuconolactone decarboxylase family protein [Rhodocyclaceae bacterium]
MSIYTDQVNELVAIAAAIGANCEPCLKYHYDAARKLGVSNEDMLSAVRMALRVKQAPANAMIDLAGRLLGSPLEITKGS